MTTLPAEAELGPNDLSGLLGRCQQLCEHADGLVAGLPDEHESFLVRSLEDVLLQLEVVLRAVDEEGQECSQDDEPHGFLRRLTRGLALRDSQDAAQREASERALPNLSRAHHGLQGNSWTIPLPELIGFLAFGRKSGVLWVDGPDENYLIGLENGNLTHATSSNTPEGLRVGEILVGYGFLTRRQLERFLTVDGENDEEASGEALLASGLISDDELQAALVYQVQQLFLRLLETKNAIFRFREGMQIQLAYPVDLNITQLLLESARVQDEVSQNVTLKALVEEMSGSKPSAHTPEEWDAWNREVLNELSKLVQEQPSDGAGEGDSASTFGTGVEETSAEDSIVEVDLHDELEQAEDAPAASGEDAGGEGQAKG